MATTNQEIQIKCLEATQPIGTMYIGVIDSDDLVFISYADVRRLLDASDNREVEDYIGIQRKLDPKREKDIGKYVNLVDSSFPNSIILSISSDDAKYDKEKGEMTINYKDTVAKVLDGQHRIAGLQHYKGGQNSFQCIVTIYIDMDLEDQAILFATINKEQKNVSSSLVSDLFAFANSRSPQKTAHNIVRALNIKEGSPFYKKIKILGTAINKDLETITQATFAKSLIQYISKDPQTDRDFYKRNINTDIKLDLPDEKEAEKYFLRRLFIEDEKDLKIAQIIYNYFHAVQKKWPDAWNNITPNIILNRSAGFIALMRLFKHAYKSFNKPDSVINKDEFYSIFEDIDMNDEDFNKDDYVPGSSGQGDLYRDLLHKSGLK